MWSCALLENHRAAGFHDAAEWHARRTGRLAGAALEAEIEMTRERRRGLSVAICERPQQVDAAPRRVGLNPELEICGALLKAEAAMNAPAEVSLGRHVVGRWRGSHARSIQCNGPG